MITDDQLLRIRDQVGWSQPPSDADLEDMFDRLGTIEAVVVAELQRQLSELLAQPADLDVPGYSRNYTQNIKSLETKIAVATAVKAEAEQATASVAKSVPITRLLPRR